MANHLLPGFFVALLSALVEASPAAQHCQPVGAIVPYCGFQAPEDLELTPAGDSLVISEFGGLLEPLPGRIVRFDLATETRKVIYPAPNSHGAPDWGSSACPGAPSAQFAPHGIHLSQRSNGDWQLLVVNHGGREAIEFFQLSAGKPLLWRGCVVLPDVAFVNDVVALNNGGFLATHMADRDDPELLTTLLSGKVAGQILTWQPGKPVGVLGDERYAFPNGIQISEDQQTLFLNEYGAGQVRKISLRSTKTLGTVPVPSPDNSTWSDDGRLLVASHTGDIDYEKGECHSVTSGFCPMAFQIVAIDPITLETEVLFEHQGAPMGAGTAAVKRGNALYIGSFSGDRMIKVPLPEPTSERAESVR